MLCFLSRTYMYGSKAIVSGKFKNVCLHLFKVFFSGLDPFFAIVLPIIELPY